MRVNKAGPVINQSFNRRKEGIFPFSCSQKVAETKRKHDRFASRDKGWLIT